MKENVIKSTYAMEIFAPLVPPIGKTLAAKNISIMSPARLADYRVGWTKNRAC